MGRLATEICDRLDRDLDVVDGALDALRAGPAGGRQPVHTVYVPADAVTPGLARVWGRRAQDALRDNPPLPFDDDLRDRVADKLVREPVEDLRIDFEDGYGLREDAEEDAAVTAAVAALHADGPLPPFVGLRCKSFERPTRARAVRTLDRFLEAWLAAAPLPDGFRVTLPKASHHAQVEALVTVCAALERAYGLPERTLRFELQVETPWAVLDPVGLPGVVTMIGAAAGRCAGLHYGTYDYSAALGIAPAYQAMDHPVADHAKSVMQVAAAAHGVPVSDGSTNVLPVGDHDAIRAAWRLHAHLVRRSLERGFYQGWDLHPAQLPTRYAATYGFFRDGLVDASARLSAYLDRRATGVLDEPATARALAGFLLRGLDCGAFDEYEVPFDRPTLERL